MMRLRAAFGFGLLLAAVAAPAKDTRTNDDPIIPAGQGATLKGSGTEDTSIRWRPVLREAAMLFGMTQGFRLITQADTRESLRGPYFRDYFESLKGLGGWGDDDPPLTNYVAHPIQGSVCTWMLVHHDPKGAPLEFEMNRAYWRSRLKGLGFSAAYSTFYELGPLGDAAIGNLGMRRDYKGMVDVVITPTVGLAWHLTEDALDRYFIRWLEQRTANPVVNALTRTWLNPTRAFANILRFRRPWERETRPGVLRVRDLHREQRTGAGINGVDSP
jgi:hypothetical protein